MTGWRMRKAPDKRCARTARYPKIPDPPHTLGRMGGLGARVVMILARLGLVSHIEARTGNETQHQCNAMQLKPLLLIDGVMVAR